METEVMLTTFDNPYDPFDDFDQWYSFDKQMHYDTCEKIARIARSSESFSTIEDKEETERAIDEIIDNDFLNIYKKVTRTVEKEEDDVEEDEED
jgi:hypothetical protein